MIRYIREIKNPFHGLWSLTHRELKKWYKAPIVLFISVVQPIIWIGLFGKAMNINAIFTSTMITLNQKLPPNFAEQIMSKTFGTLDYFSFMAVGMLSFVILFSAMFSGMSIVWDRRLGFLNKVLSTPVARGVIIVSKIFSATIRSLIQAGIVLLAALLLGLHLHQNITFLKILGVFLVLLLLCVGLASMFLMIAIRSTRWETQMAVVNLLNLPLLFASNVLFPVKLMPSWLQTVAKVNPITYATDAIRQLLIYETNFSQLTFDLIYLTAFTTVLVITGIILSWKYLNK